MVGAGELVHGLGLGFPAVFTGEQLFTLCFVGGLLGHFTVVPLVVGAGELIHGLGLGFPAIFTGEQLFAFCFIGGLLGDLAVIPLMLGAGELFHNTFFGLAANGAGKQCLAFLGIGRLLGDFAIVPSVFFTFHQLVQLFGLGLVAQGAVIELFTIFLQSRCLGDFTLVPQMFGDLGGDVANDFHILVVGQGVYDFRGAAVDGRDHIILDGDELAAFRNLHFIITRCIGRIHTGIQSNGGCLIGEGSGVVIGTADRRSIQQNPLCLAVALELNVAHARCVILIPRAGSLYIHNNLRYALQVQFYMNGKAIPEKLNLVIVRMHFTVNRNSQKNRSLFIVHPPKKTLAKIKAHFFILLLEVKRNTPLLIAAKGFEYITGIILLAAHFERFSSEIASHQIAGHIIKRIRHNNSVIVSFCKNASQMANTITHIIVSIGGLFMVKLQLSDTFHIQSNGFGKIQ